MHNKNRVVRTEISQNGYLIFRLLQGAQKLRTIKVFGYSAQNKLWVRIFGLNDRATTTIPLHAVEAKEIIGSWNK
jgi:hypothetical protein